MEESEVPNRLSAAISVIQNRRAVKDLIDRLKRCQDDDLPSLLTEAIELLPQLGYAISQHLSGEPEDEQINAFQLLIAAINLLTKRLLDILVCFFEPDQVDVQLLATLIPAMEAAVKLEELIKGFKTALTTRRKDPRLERLKLQLHIAESLNQTINAMYAYAKPNIAKLG